MPLGNTTDGESPIYFQLAGARKIRPCVRLGIVNRTQIRQREIAVQVLAAGNHQASVGEHGGGERIRYISGRQVRHLCPGSVDVAAGVVRSELVPVRLGVALAQDRSVGQLKADPGAIGRLMNQALDSLRRSAAEKGQARAEPGTRRTVPGQGHTPSFLQTGDQNSQEFASGRIQQSRPERSLFSQI